MIILADPRYNPNFKNESDIKSELRLTPGVTLSKFLGSYSDPTPLRRYTGDKKQLARNLYLHAELLRSINNDNKLFKDVTVIVSEGVYLPRVGDASPAGDNLLKNEGRLVVYQVVDTKGEIDHDRTFDVAEFWKDYAHFDKLALEYDTLDVNGKLNSQIAVTLPTVPESFDMSFGYEVETLYNFNLLSSNELIEVTA
jgi:hypothetical protein